MCVHVYVYVYMYVYACACIQQQYVELLQHFMCVCVCVCVCVWQPYVESLRQVVVDEVAHFVRFINMMLNDVLHCLDDAILKLQVLVWV